MASPFDDLFAVEAGSAFARQLALADLVDDRPWNVDIDRGEIAFGNDLTFPVQILGTAAEQDNSWLWAWANSQSDLPPAILKACERIRVVGAERGIEEFSAPRFALDRVTDHMLAMACGAVVDRSCYYRGPYQGGAAFFLLENLPAAIRAPVSAERVGLILPQVISNFEVDHRVMAENFLRQQGFALEAKPASISAKREADGAEFTLSFDPQGRIAKVDGVIKPKESQQPGSKKSWWKP